MEDKKYNNRDDNNPTQYNNNLNKFAYFFKNFTSYDIENFTTYKNFANWLHRPTDAAALGIFRILFGIAMLIDIPEERGGGHIDLRFGDPKLCHFPLIESIQPLSLPLIGLVYLIMWLGALGIVLGYKFKISCLLFCIPYWYIFLLDKPAWNNHSYLYGLCGVILFFTNSHKFCSIDFWKLESDQQYIPYWNYFIIKFQFFILYFYAGLKKLSIEWLSGYSMTNLGYHWLFLLLRYFMSVELIELLIIHWTTAIFDVTIAFWMTWKKTRIWASPFMLIFHLMNSRLFSIGMFPWVCLAEVHLFFQPCWPRKFQDNVKNLYFRFGNVRNNFENKLDVNISTSVISKINVHQAKQKLNKCTNANTENSNPVQTFRIILIIFYCLTQIFLPYSHFITKGYNNWTNGLYGYSWDMMVHSYDTISVSIKVVDNENNESHFLNPEAFSQYDRWTKHADMAYQYAKCIQRNLLNDLKVNPNPVIRSKNFSIYFDIWCSMNGRFQQRIFDPREDLTIAIWQPFKKTPWILPLLHELNYMRPRLNEITKDVLSWSNYSDVLFIADFPGLILENYISPELFNVTLTVIEGEIDFFDSKSLTILSTGNNFRIKSGQHKIITKSIKPSSYMYTFVNSTMLNSKEIIENLNKQDKWLPIWSEILERIENYKDFFYHVGNSLLFLIYGVPIPVRIREHN